MPYKIPNCYLNMLTLTTDFFKTTDVNLQSKFRIKLVNIVLDVFGYLKCVNEEVLLIALT